jgi:hypothetical protein
MNCEQFEDALVGDPLDEREAAKAHAAECAHCATLWRDDLELSHEVEAWKAAEPMPPRRLERRIAARIAEREGRTRRTTVVAWRSFAAAAVLALTALALWQLGAPLRKKEVSPIERALQEAETSRTRYVEAIAELERQTKPLLARAGDPALDAEKAALLLRYRDRLTHLDSVLEEVQTFLEEHPGHAGAHAVLLAAYEEKKEVLVEVLSLDRGDAS